MSDHPEGRNGFVNPSVRFEPTDLALRPVLTFMGGLVVVIAVLAGGLALMLWVQVGGPRNPKSDSYSERGPWKVPTNPSANASPVEDSRLAAPPAFEEIDQNTASSEGGGAHTRRIAEQVMEEEDRLHSYGWVDEDKKIVHIPIKTAMDRMAGKGEATP